MEAQESWDSQIDLIVIGHSRSIQHNQGKENVKSIEGTVKYVRKIVDYEQGVFDAKVVQSSNVWKVDLLRII